MDTVNFEKTIKFLKDYEWIFNFKVTEILDSKNLSLVPPEWATFLKETSLEDFNRIMAEDFYDKDFCDKNEEEYFIRNFKSKLKEVNIKNSSCISENEIISKQTKNKCRGWSEKKVHEVFRFSHFIKERFKNEVKCIVDVGSGLGYLDEQLLKNGFDVVGIECNPGIHAGALTRFKDVDKAGRKIIHIQHQFGNDAETLEAMTQNIPDNEKACLLALHACGDLTNSIINQFINCDTIKCLAVIPCCYHKMKETFPLSKELSDLVKEEDISIFNHYFLRLGANEPISRWHNMSKEDHEEHKNNVVFRAILELFAKEQNVDLKKKRRKATKKSEATCFDKFIENIENVYDLNLSHQDLSLLEEIYLSKQDVGQYVENLTGLQFVVQSVVENLILRDKVKLLQESGIPAYLFDLFDDVISPRNKVIFAVKS